MRAAVIDIGSSSIQLFIGEKVENDVVVLEALKNLVPLGRHTLLKERIAPKVVGQVVGVLEKYKQKLKEYDITQVRVVATSAVREARNNDMFVDTVLRQTGLPVELLTVGDVVYYIDAYLHHKLRKTYPIHAKKALIAELGTGSLDLSVMDKGFTQINVGLSVGTLVLKEMAANLEGSRAEVNEALAEYLEKEAQHLRRMLAGADFDDVILIDENYSAHLRAILPRKQATTLFYQLEPADVDELLAALDARTADEVTREFGIPAEAAETMRSYALLVRLLLALGGQKFIHVLETSLAEAILAQTLLNVELAQKYQKTNQLVSVATFLCKKYNADLKHAQQVARLAETMARALLGYLGIKEEEVLYLILAAYLHDLGMFVHNRSHHKHSEYIISALNLFRLTDEEIKLIACVARYHRKAPPLRSHLLYQSLPAQRQILAQKLAALIRIANALDTSHKQKIAQLSVEITKGQDVVLKAQVQGNAILEKSGFKEKKDLFEEISGNRISLAFTT
ncbi:MAG: HD domain-containing protein [Verrucomicrobia bacterium]|nr:HD domain-containing protein [Verrucomicrobiota bacterium]